MTEYILNSPPPPTSNTSESVFAQDTMAAMNRKMALLDWYNENVNHIESLTGISWKRRQALRAQLRQQYDMICEAEGLPLEHIER